MFAKYLDTIAYLCINFADLCEVLQRLGAIAVVDLARDRLLKVNEVAKRFRVHRRTVEAWFERGLESVMVGRLLFTSEEALARFAQPRDHNIAERPSSTSANDRRVQEVAREFSLSL